MTTFSRYAGYILLKWTIFYFYQFVSSSTKWSWNRTNSEGLLLAAFMLLALPLVELIVLFFPFQFALRSRGWILISLLTAIFGLEFILGWVATNQSLEVWMVDKIILSAGLFGLIFRKELTFKIRNH